MRNNYSQKHVSLTAIHILLIAFLWVPLDTYADDSNLNKADISNEIKISSSDGRYSLFARQAKLSDILYELGQTAGFELKIFENLSNEISDWDYESMVLVQLINNLLRDYNTVMLFEESPYETQTDSSRKLKELWLIASDDNTAPAQSVSRSIEIELEQPEMTASTDQEIPAEQQDETKQDDSPESLNNDDVIETLTQTLLSAPDPAVRKRAVTELGRIGGTQVLDALEAGLADDSGVVRTEIARSFAGIQDQRSILALGQMSVGDEDAGVRQQAIRSLSMQDSAAAHAFIEAALNDEDESVQQTAKDILQ